MTSELLISVARIIPHTSAEGPGHRFAVWVQGCTIRCDGCFNPHLWTPTGGMQIAPEALARQASGAGVDGVTILGGEPFDQPKGLATFAALAHQTGLSVMTFTGNAIEELRNDQDPDVAALLEATDLLVDGPYVADRPDLTRPWVGSTNQRFHFLSERYRHLESDLASLPDRVEVRVASNGQVSLNGWATVDQLDSLLAGDVLAPFRRGRVR